MSAFSKTMRLSNDRPNTIDQKIENELAQARALLEEKNHHGHPVPSRETPTRSNLNAPFGSEISSGSRISPIAIRPDFLPPPQGNVQASIPMPPSSRQDHAVRCALLPPEPISHSTAFEWDERKDVMEGRADPHLSRSTDRGGYFGKGLRALPFS
ncbi:hypothetical protein AnigIFM59636_008478 [Aspergillus niger]|nr:hypothetical protein AnigIFM59636_008478 [Aspergillus niger]